MKLSKIKELLNGECIVGDEFLDEYEVYYAFGCDLMSDVLAFSNENTLLLTGLTNAQVIRTAEMLDISSIVFVRGKKPDDNTIELARTNNKILLSTKHILYTSCGILFSNGLKGVNLK